MATEVTFSDAREMTDRALRIAHEAKIARVSPLEERVLLRRLEEDDGKQVAIADAYKPKSNKGEVLAVGLRVLTLKKGDQVLFGEYSAQEIEVDGEPLVLISVHDIWLRL